MRRFDTLLLLSVGCSMGIAVSTFFPILAFDVMVSIILLGIACGFSMLGRPLYIQVGFFLVSMLGGLWLGSRTMQYWEHLPEPSESFRGVVRVVSLSRETVFFQESEVRSEYCESALCPKEVLLLRESGSVKRVFGERLFLECQLKRPPDFIEKAGRQVIYRLMLASRGIGYVCEKPIAVREMDDYDTVMIIVQRGLFLFRNHFVTVIERALPAAEANLSLGMLIGADEGFSIAERELFLHTGVTHVTAVSGYNITLVGGLLFFLAIVCGCYRRSASVVAVMGIVGYVFLVGAPASAVRAGIMGALILLSLGLGRPGSGFRIWIFALASMLLWNPLFLRFDIGFQLSYLATFAILLYLRIHDRVWMPRQWMARVLFEGLLISLSVEWLVAPIILLQFGTFSVVSLIANVFLVLLVPCIMLATFLAGIVGFIIPGGVFFLNGIAFFLAHLFFRGAEMLDRLPMSFVSNLSISAWWGVIWYAVTGYAFWFLLWRKRDMMREDER